MSPRFGALSSRTPRSCSARSAVRASTSRWPALRITAVCVARRDCSRPHIELRSAVARRFALHHRPVHDTARAEPRRLLVALARPDERSAAHVELDLMSGSCPANPRRDFCVVDERQLSGGPQAVASGPPSPAARPIARDVIPRTSSARSSMALHPNSAAGPVSVQSALARTGCTLSFTG
jgi:hypothetical protein